MNWYTSDTHFYHRNIIKYCGRPFSNVSEMNDHIIVNWNSCVGRGDVVYHLGDFAMTNDIQEIKEIASLLNGKIKLVIGSHDAVILKHREELLERGTFDAIDKNYQIKVRGETIFMAHYLHRIWPKSHYNSWHLFGHSHCKMNWFVTSEGAGRILDVGVDCHGFSPWSHEDIQTVMLTRSDNANYVG